MTGLVEPRGYCRRCVHLFWEEQEADPLCQYLLDEGRPRPCPAGRGCVARKRIGRGRGDFACGRVTLLTAAK